MSDRIALIIGIVIVALCAADILANEGRALFFLARKLFDLVEYLAFWR